MSEPRRDGDLGEHLAHWLARQRARGLPRVLGLGGAQGCGKSTAAAALAAADPALAVLSLDDFYLTRAEREALAARESPLLGTRGPPGTHDLPRLRGAIDALRSGRSARLPQFSKRDDDRLPGLRELAVAQPALILVEGWLVGATAPADFLDSPPRNALEAGDTDLRWRRYQHAQLAGPYQALWDLFDDFLYIDAPGFDAVLGWRLQQEATTLGVAADALPAARRAWVEHFIQHYQRLTEAILAGARRPGSALRVDRERRVVGVAP